VFALDLMSTYEGEHTIFGLLSQANLTQNDVLQARILLVSLLDLRLDQMFMIRLDISKASSSPYLPIFL
jgi:hypothetical protein